jgi:hypothetical protein
VIWRRPCGINVQPSICGLAGGRREADEIIARRVRERERDHPSRDEQEDGYSAAGGTAKRSEPDHCLDPA